MAENGTPTGAGYGAPKTVLFNLDEQILSSKINNLQLFIGAELTDLVARLCGPDQTGTYGSAGNFPSGVLTGFEGTVSGLNVTIAGGLGFTASLPGGNPADASQVWQWIKATSSQNVTLTANADPSNKQWALVCAIPNETASSAASVAVWNPLLNGGAGGAQTQTLDQRQDPGATLTVVYGASASTPALPSAPAAGIALLAVLLPPGSASPAASAIYDARKILAPALYGMSGFVNGLSLRYGGANQVEIGAGRAYVNGSLVQLDADFNVSLANMVAAGGSGSIAANSPYYLYIVPTSAGLPVVPQTDASCASNVPTSRPGTGFILVASSIVPTREGAPSSTLTVGINYAVSTNGTLVPPNSAAGLGTALFAGSILTDNSSNLVFFSRKDSTVTLSSGDPTIVSGIVAKFDAGAGYGTTTWTGGSGSYPQAKTFTFGSGGTSLIRVPASASASLVDAFMQALVPVGTSGGINPTVLFENTGETGLGGAAQLSTSVPSTGTIIGATAYTSFVGGSNPVLDVVPPPVAGLFRYDVFVDVPSPGTDHPTVALAWELADGSAAVSTTPVNMTLVAGAASMASGRKCYQATGVISAIGGAGNDIIISVATSSDTYNASATLTFVTSPYNLNASGQFTIPGGTTLVMQLLADPLSPNTVTLYTVLRGYVETRASLF